jgi:hypothetical protein
MPASASTIRIAGSRRLSAMWRLCSQTTRHPQDGVRNIAFPLWRASLHQPI